MQQEVFCIRLKSGPWKISKEQRVPVLDYHESFYKTLRLTATIIKACRIWRRYKRAPQEKDAKESLPPMQEFLDEAERYWIKHAQGEAFKSEIQDLQKGKDIHRKSKIRQYNPFLDEHGILRVGKYDRPKMEMVTWHPQIIPKGTLNTQINRQLHLHVWHSRTILPRVHGMRYSHFTYLTRRYEIMGAVVMHKRMRKACVPCQRFDAKWDKIEEDEAKALELRRRHCRQLRALRRDNRIQGRRFG